MEFDKPILKRKYSKITNLNMRNLSDMRKACYIRYYIYAI